MWILTVSLMWSKCATPRHNVFLKHMSHICRMVVILSLVNVFSSVDLISLFKLLNSIENLFNNILLLTKLRKIAKEEHTARLDFFHQPHNIPVKNAKTRTTDFQNHRNFARRHEWILVPVVPTVHRGFMLESPQLHSSSLRTLPEF